MSTDLATQGGSMPAEIAERVFVHGDISKLNSGERLAFYKARCEAAGLDPRGRPFEFLVLQGKTVLYAKKECAEQLNGMHGLSHEILSTEMVSGLYEVRVKVTSRSGRTSEDVGTVVIDGLRGADLANARMKAVTKAKRRATLSFCGLGDVIDETELDTVQTRPCNENGTPKAIQNSTGFGRGQYASPEQTEAYLAAMEGYIDKRNAKWLDQWTVHGETPDGLKELCNRWQADNHLVKWAKETGRLEIDPGTIERGGVQNRQIGRYTAIAYHRSTEDRRALAKELERYVDSKAADQNVIIRAKNPHLFADEPSEDPTDRPTDFEGDDIPDDVAAQFSDGAATDNNDAWPEGRQ